MARHGICECCVLSGTHPLSYLCLPVVIRRRIHEYAIVLGDMINLNRYLDAKQGSLEAWDRFRRFEDELLPEYKATFSLLLTCRVIHAEVSLLFYSGNEFIIRYRDSQNLQALRSLSGDSVSLLTHLTILLNVNQCDNGVCCGVYDCKHEEMELEHIPCDGHDQPLSFSSPQHQKKLLEWENTSRQTLSYIKPSTLRLDFICEVEDFEVASRVVQPLVSLPILADCRIRLGPMPDHRLGHLSHKIATRATGGNVDQFNSPFRILDLPREIRLQILE